MKIIRFFLIVCMVHTCLPPAALASTNIMGANAQRYFDLPGQPLQTGLIEFALQANVTVIAEQGLIAQYRSGPVVGPSTIDNALRLLLAEAPLQFEYIESAAAYVIRPVAAQQGAGVEPIEIVIPSIDEILVVGSQYPFRYNTITNTQLHGAVPYFDSSRFLNVIPQSLIRDQQPQSLEYVLKFASAITPGDGISDSNDDVYLRGFQRHAMYLDGFRLGDSSGVRLLPAGIERVEILKGPSTIHYGQAEPGGIVNVIRKKPKAETFSQVQLIAGDMGRLGVSVDVNRPLLNTKKANYRVIFVDDQQQESGDILNIHRQLLSSSIAWQPSANTTVDVGFEYQKASQEWDRSFEVFTEFGNIFPHRSMADVAKQARPGFTAHFNLFSAEVNHYFNPNWQLQLKANLLQEYRYGIRTTTDSYLDDRVLLNTEGLGPDFALFILGSQTVLPLIVEQHDGLWHYGLGPIRSIYDQDDEELDSGFSAKLEGSFDTANLEHNLSLGVDWHTQNIAKRYVVERRDIALGQRWDAFEFEAAFAELAQTLFIEDRPLGELEEYAKELDYSDFGAFVQDSVALTDEWLVSAGARYIVTQADVNDITLNTATQLKTFKHLSTQAGVVYKPNHDHSIFANYSEALRANYILDDIGSQITEPELSNQYEVGLKSYWLGGDVQTSVAAYHINKWNVVDVQVVEGYRTALNGATYEVQGIDFDLSAQVSPKLNVLLAASVIDPSITDGSNTGNLPKMAAEQTSSVFTHYQLNSKLDFVAGYKFVSERYADDANTFRLEAYGTFDAGVSYTFQLNGLHAKCNLSVKNLSDVPYITAVDRGARVNESAGRTIFASFQVTM
ncbi:TonB-dependent receptor [Saccharophagus degradans]|uniref:TonB-dependent receptor n=1 Tax=Saccharophagus degradans TaxID=86304 RepID=UPI001C089DA3|nr:TonB-dependent receptor [Saccharophagus degradans]MBU2987318.1 TonB-dependent receptor [Saccharophagus degradans]